MPRKRSPEAEARAGMKTLGVYKAEFEPMIRAYGQLREQYNTLTRRYERSGYSFQVETDSGAKKASARAEKSFASCVQPGVSSLG